MPSFKKTSRKTFIVTILNSFAMMILGTQMSMKGPALIDLLQISGTDVRGGSAYLTAYNFFYMVGSLTAGFLINRFQRFEFGYLSIAVGIAVSGILTGLTPWCTNFVTMLLVFSMTSIFCGIFETNVYDQQIKVGKGKSEIAMQLLIFSYAFGAIFGPLIVEPFLAPKEMGNSTDKLNTSNLSNVSILSDLGVISSLSTNNSTTVIPSFHLNQTYLFNTTKNAADMPSRKYNVRSAFLIVAIISLLTSLPCLIIFCRSWKKHDGKLDKSVSTLPSSRKLPAKYSMAVVALIAFFYFVIFATEDTFIQYLSYFVVHHLGWSKENGARLTALYYGMGMCTKLAVIVLMIVTKLRMGAILIASCTGTILSLLALAIFSQLHIHELIWICAPCLSLSLSSTFAGGMSYVDANLLEMDARAISITITGGSIGNTVIPFPMGYLMKNWSLMVFPYLLLGLSCFGLVVMCVLEFIMKRLIHRKYGPPRSKTMEISTQDKVLKTRSNNEESVHCVDKSNNEQGAHCEHEESTAFV